MAFPTVEDCAALSGSKRKLLREFDHLLRDALATTQRKARNLDPHDQEIEPACVIVLMTAAASAALAASRNPADLTEAEFTAIARDALAWAKRKLGLGDRRH
jgi:hypothetical protein